MAIEQFEVDTSFLRSDATEIGRYLETIKKAQIELTELLNSLNDAWSGPAKDAFHTKYSKDCDRLMQLCRSLDELLENLRDAAGEYDSCDNRVRSVIAGIRV